MRAGDCMKGDVPLRPLCSRNEGAGNPFRNGPFSSSASVPLSLGEDDNLFLTFLLRRLLVEDDGNVPEAWMSKPWRRYGWGDLESLFLRSRRLDTSCSGRRASAGRKAVMRLVEVGNH